MTITIKKRKYSVVKYDSRNKAVSCTCGSQCLVDGEAIYKIPIGFGFHPDGKFYSDYTEHKGYIGQCLECQRYIFAYRKKRLISKRINIKDRK